MINVTDIEARLLADLKQDVKIEPIKDVDFKSEVIDSTSKFYVHASTGSEFFLIVSSDGNPQLTKRAVENIQSACMNVPPHIANHILQPVTAGELGGLTYAVWPAKKPFPSDGRLQQFFARRRYAQPVLDWSRVLTTQTLKDGDQAIFLENLQRIYDEDAFPQPMRQDALLAQERLRAGIWQPKHCVQHSDFWTGNVLLPTKPQDPSFYIIDWAGMLSDGYPFLDLARMLISMGCKPRLCADHIEKLRTRLDCDRIDIISYTLSGLGHIGRNLEYFPPDRYQALALRVYDFMKTH